MLRHIVLIALVQATMLLAGGCAGPSGRDTPDIRALKVLEARASKAIRKSLPAIVAVHVTHPKAAPGHGDDHFAPAASGVIIRCDGLILSQWHVSHVGRPTGGKDTFLGPGDKIEVALQDGRHCQAELLGADPVRDLSLLRIVEPGNYPCLEMAKAGSVSVGDWVLKLGHPFGYRAGRGATARLGRVLYAGESIEIVADCLTFAGDSGGPLINLDGQIIGIIENASSPQLIIWSLPDRCGTPTCYTSVRTIERLMPAMLNPPSGPTFAPDFDVQNLPEHRAMMQIRHKEIYGDSDSKVIPARDWTQGERSRAKWNDLTARYAGSVVEVLGHTRRVAYGTVVGADGWILTKASEIPSDPRCRLDGGRTLPARIVGVDAAYDLALLKVDAHGLRAVEWRAAKPRPAGTLVAAPDGRGGSIGVGIVSVAERALEGPFPSAVTPSKEYVPPPEFQVVLGKMIQGKGLLVRRVKGGAATAGIVPGDLVLRVNGQPIRDADDIDARIEKSAAGDVLTMLIERGGRQIDVSVKLEEDAYIRCPGATARYRNLRADDFPRVFEHDVPLLLDECGGPLIDLGGDAIGIAIARVGQHGCMAIPGDAVAGVVSRLKH